MTRSVVPRMWDRMVGGVFPGTGRHRIHDKFSKLKTRYIAERNRAADLYEEAQCLKDMLAAEQEANRNLQGKLRASDPRRGLPPPPIPHADTTESAPASQIVIPITKVPVTEGGPSTIPVRGPQRPSGAFIVRTLSGKPLLGGIPQQRVRE